MADQGTAAPAARSGERVEEAARSFSKAIHTLRTYPRGNEIAVQALEQVTPALLGVVPIEIEVGQEQMRWGEGRVLDGSDDRTAISAALYRDGVRRFEIRDGLDPAEIERLIVALAERINPDDLSEDYVTRLWEAELPHVRVLAIDPYLDVDIPDDVLEGQHQPDLDPGDCAIDPEEEVPPPPEEAFRIREADAIRIAREVAQGSRVPPWTRFIEVVVATVTTEPGMRRPDELVTIIETCFQRLVEHGQLEEATRLLRRLKDSVPVGAMPSLLPAVGRMASADRLRPLAKAMELGETSHEEARPLLLALQPADIPALLDFLKEGSAPEAQRFYAAILAEIGAPALAAAIERFRGGTPELQLLLAPLLGKLGGPEGARALVTGLERADPTLRRELVRALGMVRDEEGSRVLLQLALDDEDESCRVLALRALQNATTPVAQDRLIERIGESGIGDEEKELLFIALGEVGDEGAIPFLTGRLKPSWIPGRWRATEARCAAAALARIGTSEALETLEHFSQSRRTELAEICTRAMLEARGKSR
jgi:HEAT repeat protein